MHINQISLAKKVGANKLILGFAALIASAVIGTAGVAAANANTPNKPTKEQCAAAGFHNYGQCVKEWAHHKNHPGGGYNGNVHVSADLNLELNNSNNNVITVIFRPIINIFR